MINFFKLLCAEWFGKNQPKLNGSNLFSGEYSASSQYANIKKLFGKTEKAFVRIPIQSTNISAFIQSANLAHSNDIEVITALDAFESDGSMMMRLNTIKNSCSYIKYFELLNELPHMNDLYPGIQITSLKELLDKINKYTDWIHQNISGGKAITMAPYNSMDERSWNTWDGVTNTRILKELILYTVADIAAVHLYGDSLGKKMQLVGLADNITAWNKEAKYPKKIWVTECGVDNWNGQIKYYDKLIKLIMNTINPEKVIWYRQCVRKATEQDNSFALEIIDNLQTSPLFNKLIV
jgi:hypothetical protein